MVLKLWFLNVFSFQKPQSRKTIRRGKFVFLASKMRRGGREIASYRSVCFHCPVYNLLTSFCCCWKLWGNTVSKTPESGDLKLQWVVLCHQENLSFGAPLPLPSVLKKRLTVHSYRQQSWHRHVGIAIVQVCMEIFVPWEVERTPNSLIWFWK